MKSEMKSSPKTASLRRWEWWWEKQQQQKKTTTKKPFSRGTGEWGGANERGGMGKWGVVPEKVWWPPVLLIFLFGTGRKRN